MMNDEIYDHIIYLADPELSEPVLVIALEGSNDAGLGASNAIGTLLDTIYTEVLATFDTEYFIDQRARRPIAAHRRRDHDRVDVARDPTSIRS